jgi:hypothetical protein
VDRDPQYVLSSAFRLAGVGERLMRRRTTVSPPLKQSSQKT